MLNEERLQDLVCSATYSRVYFKMTNLRKFFKEIAITQIERDSFNDRLFRFLLSIRLKVNVMGCET